jgi:alkylated DNA repair dioxygenase AlkB
MRKAYITTLDAPAGFEYFPDFISRPEADSLAEQLWQLPFVSHVMRGRHTKRKMHHYGWCYAPQLKTLNPAPEPIPDWLLLLRDRCAELAQSLAQDFQQAIVTLYGQKGAGIGPHVDAPAFGPCVLGVSLLSEVEMEFEREGVRYVKTLEPGSLYVMGGEARYEWKHAIHRIPNPPRLSVVFRSVANSGSAQVVAHALPLRVNAAQ